MLKHMRWEVKRHTREGLVLPFPHCVTDSASQLASLDMVSSPLE